MDLKEFEDTNGGQQIKRKSCSNGSCSRHDSHLGAQELLPRGPLPLEVSTMDDDDGIFRDYYGFPLWHNPRKE